MSELKLCPYQYSKSDSFEQYLLSLSLSKSKIKKYYSKNLLNQKLSSVIKDGEIRVHQDLLNMKIVSPFYQGPEIQILHNDQSFLVLNKPTGVHSHSLSYSDTQSCTSYLRAYGLVPSDDRLRERDYGLLYRLDRETSGVLVFAKSSDYLDMVFSHRDQYILSKKYICLVKGRLEVSGEIKHYLKSYGEKSKNVRAYRPTEVCQSAKGDYRHASLTVESCKNITYQGHDCSEVMLVLHSGHRHQIRVQMQALGHPILGDPLYSDDSISFERMYLHAYEYQLKKNNKIFCFHSAANFY